MTPILPDAFAWRKYECPAEVHIFQGCADPGYTGYVLWPSAGIWKYPHLARWDGLQGAFTGFVSRGFGPPIATAYSLDGVFENLKAGELLSRTWNAGADAAEFTEFVVYNLLGVWMGDKTPFLISTSCSWSHSIEPNLRGLS